MILKQYSMKFPFLFICLALLFLTSGKMFSQENTEEKKTLQEKILGIFEFEGKKNTSVITPLAGYNPTSKLSLGLNSYTLFNAKDTTKKDSLPSTLGVYVKYTTANWLYVQTQLSRYTKSNWHISSDIKLNRSFESYYGIALSEKPEDYIKFKSLLFYVKGAFLKGINSNAYGGITYDVGMKNAKPMNVGDILPFTEGYYMGVGPAFTFEKRENVLCPYGGSYLHTELLYYHSKTAENHSYQTFRFDYRFFFQVRKKLISATQVYSDLNTSQVPYIAMPKLFGQNRLRGISNDNKYMGQNVMYIQTELRQDIIGPIAIVAFGGIGNAFNSFDSLADSKLKYSFGIGGRLRMSQSERLNSRLDVGFGPDGDMGIYIVLKEAF